MGPYCHFCGSRCFVVRDELKATCPMGKAWDRMADLAKSCNIEFLTVHQMKAFTARKGPIQS